MADKVITIAGQRIKVLPFSDYYLDLLKSLFDSDGSLVFNLERHSDLIAMSVEVAAPTLPKSFYRKVGATYRWLGSKESFNELVLGIWLSFWEFELINAQSAKSADRISMAQFQIDFVMTALQEAEQQLQAINNESGLEAEPDLSEQTVEELQAELEELRAKVAATV